MKRSLVTVLGSAALLVAVSPAAKADAFLSLQNQAVVPSCDNSTAAGVAALLSPGSRRFWVAIRSALPGPSVDIRCSILR